MADLPIYKSIDDKRHFFSNGTSSSFVINTRVQLDKWFIDVEENDNEESKSDATALIYRGSNEANFKLITSAQRIWIANEMQQWAGKKYLEFVTDLIKTANQNTLIKKAFDFYNYSKNERDFPVLSLLQHYGAPTPIMDWTYNQNVAFFFATDRLKKVNHPKTDIDDYFSVYRINKRKYKRELLNIIDVTDKDSYPPLSTFYDFSDDNNPKSNSIFYISDFERRGESTGITTSYGTLKIRTRKPFTSTYNQNIIPQEGLFIFNPSSYKPLEDLFNVDLNNEGWNLNLKPFDCFNIHKDLSEYLTRKTDIKHKINKSFIYPNLNDECSRIKERTLNELIK